MKHPDLILRMLIACLLCLPASLLTAQTKVSFEGGPNLSKVSWKESSNSPAIKNKWNPGYRLALLTTIPITLERHSLHLQTGLAFSTKGYRQDYDDGSGKEGVLSVDPWYAELPLNILYTIPGNIDRFFIGAGGYYAYGLGGKWTLNYKPRGWDNGIIEYTDISKQNPYDKKFNYGRRPDMGINLLLGVFLSPDFTLGIAGQLGLKNIAPPENHKITKEEFRNRTLSLSIAYNL
ncbi:outer membrane beta-barrel protein [Niabella hirudinis]|uniref:outer membrane beta-barrel protein n=1 Tax=Niabella hirudinis TaxID=1285929 RepID=UPI003EB7CEDF